METCHNCGKIILSDYRFCPRCGYSIYGESAAGTENSGTPGVSGEDRAGLFFELARNLGEAENIDLLLKKIGDAIEKILDAERSSTLLLDETGKFLFFKVASGESALQKLKIPLDKGIAGWIATNRKGEIVNDPYNDERFSPEADKTTGFRTTSIVGVPLLLGDTLLGVCEAINKRAGGFTEEDVQVLTGFAGLASVSIANLRLKTDQKNLYSNLLEFLVMAAESLGSPEASPKGHAWEMARLAPRFGQDTGLGDTWPKCPIHHRVL